MSGKGNGGWRVEGGITPGRAGSAPGFQAAGRMLRTSSRTQRRIAQSGFGASPPTPPLRRQGEEAHTQWCYGLSFSPHSLLSVPPTPSHYYTAPPRTLSAELKLFWAKCPLLPRLRGCCGGRLRCLAEAELRALLSPGFQLPKHSPDLISASERPPLSRGKRKEMFLQLAAGPEFAAAFGDSRNSRRVQRVRATTSSHRLLSHV